MKSIRTIIISAFLALLTTSSAFAGDGTENISWKSDSLAFVQAEWSVTPYGRHASMKCASIRMFNSIQHISIIEYNPLKYRSSIFQYDGGGHEVTSVTARNHRARFALNGSYFNVKTMYPNTYVRVGRKLYGRTLPREMYRVNGVVAFKDRRGHRPLIMACDTSGYESLDCHSVLAAGPMLLSDGKMYRYEKGSSNFYNSRHPRSFIGYREKGSVFLVVIDGRSSVHAAGMTIGETAAVAAFLGLDEAINLDGGGSSSLWSKENGVVSHPTDNRKFDHEGERKVPNFILVR